MTEINGLRLAYRGFVAGLAGAYVWVAIAMTLSAIVHADPLFALRPFALVIVGGLFSRLLISIFLMPVLYVAVARDGDHLEV